MEEIKLNMENLTKEEREQLLKLVEKANKKESGVWKPARCDIYIAVDSNSKVGLSVNQWINSERDEFLYAIGNCFKTKEEAEFALERQKVIVELERFAKENNEELRPGSYWFLMYSNLHSSITESQIGDWYPYGVLFSSRDIAERAVEVIGEDRLKKYYFGVKD